METAERRHAIGPFASEEALLALEIVPNLVRRGSEGWELADHVALSSKQGAWLSSGDRSVLDRAVEHLGDRYTVVTVDCWNAFSENATVARFRIERFQGDAVEVEHADRRYPDLARAGMLRSIAATWLAEKVRSLGSSREPKVSKKEREQRERAARFLTLMVESGALTLSPGSTVVDLTDRARRILFVMALGRSDAVSAILRMCGDSKHVARDGTPREALDGAIRTALDAIRYRK